MGMYDTFETDEDLENTGIWLDYGDFRIRVASASPNNKKHVKLAEKLLKPLRKMMKIGAVSNEKSNEVMRELYAKTIILDWQVKVDGEWKTGIEGRDGDLLPVNEANILEVLKNLPMLFIDIQEQANSITNYRKVELEDEAGN